MKSVLDFVRSNLFSNIHLTLQHEDALSAQVADAADMSLTSIDVRRRQTMENAARVSLLLTRSFIEYCQRPGASSHNKNEIKLDDFFIKVNRGGRDFPSSQIAADGLFPPAAPSLNNSNGKINDGQLQLGIDFYADKLIKLNEKANGPKKDDSLPGDQCTILGISTSRGVEATVSDNTTSLENMTLSWQHSMNDLTPMQVLGKLLYGVFSQGKEVPPHLCVGTTGPPQLNAFGLGFFDVVDDDYDIDLRSSQNRRTSETSFFSSLLESNFPASVCRFLSDMLTDSTDNHTSSTFSSFEEVKQDLEQMIEEPKTFLHDLHSPFEETQLPMFGERYIGRKEEVTKLIKIPKKMEEDQSSLRIQAIGHGDGKCSGKNQVLDAVFVSGVAGSGKSHLVQTVVDSLSEGIGWIVIKSKFERGMEHASRGIVSRMFNQVITYLVNMKESENPSDVEFSRLASKSIMDALGIDGLSLLVSFLPSLPLLFGCIFNDMRGTIQSTENMVDWQLIDSLSKILDAVLELDRFILICCDDLQWADGTTITLIGELLINVAGSKNMKRRCLLVGLYREDEVNDSHPLTVQYSYLQMSSDVKTTEIKINSLSEDDVIGMIMKSLRLPQRLVIDLASVVHKKTAGHALFVVQLLNALVRDSTIAYSSQLCRYVWDPDRVDLIQTSDGVAGLIASNFSLLSHSSQLVLQILSTFGIQTDIQLLSMLENYHKGIVSSLPGLINKGIIDQAGPIVIFSHDIIQQEIYERMPLAKRQSLHLDIGKLLGTMHIQDARSSDSIYFAGKNITSSLISLACDQINSAGQACFRCKRQEQKFAKWNFMAGQEATSQSNFRAALYYFSRGIAFLGEEDCWSKNKILCLNLHEGSALSSYALGESENAIQYGKQIIDHGSLEETLGVWTVILRSLTVLNKHDECISKGISILRRLGFDLPLSPTKEIINDAMADAESLLSAYSVDQIVNLCEMASNDPVHNIARVMDAIYGSCFNQSLFLPLFACATVKYTLQNGMCEGSATAFASFGQFLIFFHGDYDGGKKCADVVEAITQKHHDIKFSGNPLMLVCITLDIWFHPPRVLSKKLLKCYQNAMASGEAHLAMIALGSSTRCRIYGGENLSLINQSMPDHTKLIAQHSEYAANFDALDKILVGELMGSSSSRSKSIINDLQSEAESRNEARLLFRVHFFKVMISYWRGDFTAAEKSSDIAAKVTPVSNMPSMHLIYFTFFRGLVAFQCYSEYGGDKRLQYGKEMVDRMGIWAKNCMAVFGNKWLLLKAEYAALTKNGGVDAEQLYKESIYAAKDHGFIHELGLAYELLGDYYTVHRCEAASIQCMKNAYKCYTQWGATAIANKILNDNDLEIDSSSGMELQLKLENTKRQRGQE